MVVGLEKLSFDTLTVYGFRKLQHVTAGCTIGFGRRHITYQQVLNIGEATKKR
jgi:hypothetical protein